MHLMTLEVCELATLTVSPKHSKGLVSLNDTLIAVDLKRSILDSETERWGFGDKAGQEGVEST